MRIAWDARVPHASVRTCLLIGQRWKSQVGYGDAHAPNVLGRGRAAFAGVVSRGALGIKNPLPVTQHLERVIQYAPPGSPPIRRT
jgi:hypothetical protein